MAEIANNLSPAEVAEAQKVAEGMKVLNTVNKNPFWVTGNIDPLRVENLMNPPSADKDYKPGNVDYNMTSFQTNSPNNTLGNIHAFENVALDDTTDPVQEAGENVEKNEKPYTIVKWDTLSKIARENNISVEALAKMNNIKDVNKIFEGKTLNIPKSGEVKTDAKANTSEDKPEAKAGEKTGEPTKTEAPTDTTATSEKPAEAKPVDMKPVDTKPVSTTEHNKTPGSSVSNQRAEDYKSAVHGTPRGDFGKTRWMHVNQENSSIPEMPKIGDILSRAKSQIEAKWVHLSDYWVTIEDNKITIPGKEPITIRNISVNIENDNLSVDFGGNKGQKHLLTVGADGVVQLDMKPLTTIGKDVLTQASSVESNAHKPSDNPDAEWLAGLEANPWQKPQTQG